MIYNAFVGLDVGTTSIKAVCFDGGGTELAKAAQPTPTRSLADNQAEYDADELWFTATKVLKALAIALEDVGAQIRGIAVASMGESGVLLDPTDRPIAPVIAWFDPRTRPQADQWALTVGVERTQQIAGLTPRPVFGAAKMLWMKQHLPGEWSQGRSWLNIADWVALRLCGEKATDYSLASRTMLLDLAQRTWSSELVSAAELDEALLAPLVQSGAPLGEVTAVAAEATGLPIGAVVGAGGQDHVCAALALDVTRPGTLLDSIGTAEALFLVTEAADTTGYLASKGIGQGIHVEPGRTYAMTGLQSGGGRIDARRRDLALDWDSFLSTPEAEAVVAELASEGQARIEDLLKATGTETVRHIVTGGGSRNERLIELKESAGGRPVERATQTEATAQGAAILAKRAYEEAVDKGED